MIRLALLLWAGCAWYSAAHAGPAAEDPRWPIGRRHIHRPHRTDDLRSPGRIHVTIWRCRRSGRDRGDRWRSLRGGGRHTHDAEHRSGWRDDACATGLFGTSPAGHGWLESKISRCDIRRLSVRPQSPSRMPGSEREFALWWRFGAGTLQVLTRVSAISTPPVCENTRCRSSTWRLRKLL
jgi:hypothetical protein